MFARIMGAQMRTYQDFEMEEALIQEMELRAIERERQENDRDDDDDGDDDGKSCARLSCW